MNASILLKLTPAVVLAAMLSACVNLTPVADPTRFYVLTVDPAKEPLAEPAKRSLPVFVAPVDTPAYLDHPRLVVRKQGNELAYAEFYQWAEPVRDGLTRCLREHLAAWLGVREVHPLGRRWPSGDYLEVQASVSRFEATQTGRAVLAVRWRIVQAKNGAVLQAQQTEVIREIPGAGTDPGGTVLALSEAVGVWSRKVAEALSAHASVIGRAKAANE